MPTDGSVPGRDAEAYLNALLEAAVDAIIVIDHQGCIKTFNAAAERLFGYSAAEALNRNVRLLMPEPYQSQHDRYLQNYLHTGQRRIIGSGREVTGLRKDGSIFPMDLAVGEINLPDAPRFVGIVRDLSARAKAAEELHRQREDYRMILDAVPALIWYLDHQGRVRRTNAAVSRFLGLTREELRNKSFFDLFKAAQAPLLEASHRAILDSATPRLGELVDLPTPQGSRWVQMDRIPQLDDAGHTVGLITVAQDITERLHAEKEASQHRERLAHITRLHSLGEMAAGIAHEINQPLTAVANYSQAARHRLQSGTADTVKIQILLAKIDAQAQRAGKIIRRIRNLSRRGDNHYQTIDINTLIRDGVELARADTRSLDCQLELELAENLPPITVDQIQIQQVIINLLRNALDAMETVPAADRRICLKTQRHASGEVMVSVSDWGIGLPNAGTEQLFDPFFTTKHSGLGVGLSISRSIITSHGGQLWFSVNPQCGAVFHFTLPANLGHVP